MTWTAPSPTGRSLLCNRDEQRTRPSALPPSVQTVNDVRVLTPVDPQAGGTWLLANELGLIATLLNFYEATPPPSQRPPEGYRSRGLLLRSLGDCSDGEEVHDRLKAAVAESTFAPFWILALRMDGAVHRWRWDGRSLDKDLAPDNSRPMTTSSWQTEPVLAERARLFDEQAHSDAEDLEVYHRSCSSKGGPWGPCMARSDARTVSLSRINLTPDEIQFSYQDRSPDDIGFSTVQHSTLHWHSCLQP